MRVISILCLKDNFSYLVIDGTYVACVDPSEPTTVGTVLDREGIQLSAIWLTHHHWDHVGGVDGLLARFPGIEVISHVSDRERLPKVTRGVDDGDTIQMESLQARVLHNPGHTLGAISYVVDSSASLRDAARSGEAGPFHGSVFTGDTLFGAGCGRVFEGTMDMMHASLQKLAQLPKETRVYFGHEYTAANLRFAAHVEPDNAEVAARANALGTPTTPSTMALELATNPFLRARDAAQFAERRTAKDTFKG